MRARADKSLAQLSIEFAQCCRRKVALRDTWLVRNNDYRQPKIVQHANCAWHSRKYAELIDRKWRVDDPSIMMVDEAINDSISIEKYCGSVRHTPSSSGDGDGSGTKHQISFLSLKMSKPTIARNHVEYNLAAFELKSKI